MNPRTKLVNPLAHDSCWERCAQAGAVDLRDNYREEVLPSGYVNIVPIDPTKVWTMAKAKAAARRRRAKRSKCGEREL